jgi:disease resistance protein RPM1
LFVIENNVFLNSAPGAADIILHVQLDILGCMIGTMLVVSAFFGDFCRFNKDELETMQAFLVAAEAMKEKDLLLKVWAKQVRDLSYNIEDCFAEFMVHVASQSLSRQLMKLKDRHRIAMQIRDLKSRVEEVSNRNTRYNLVDKNQVLAKAIEERESCMEDICNQSGSNIDETELVGFSEPKKKLIDHLALDDIDEPA